MSQRPDQIPPRRYAWRRQRDISARVPTPPAFQYGAEEFGASEVLETFDFDAFIQVDDSSASPEPDPRQHANAAVVGPPGDEPDGPESPISGLEEATALAARNNLEYHRLPPPHPLLWPPDTIADGSWYGRSINVVSPHPIMYYQPPLNAPRPRSPPPSWVNESQQNRAARVLSRRGSLAILRGDDRAERDLDRRLVQWMDPVHDWFAYSFGFRYCSDDYQAECETQGESSEDEKEPSLRSKFLTAEKNKRKPLPLLFMPSRGHLSRRLDKIREPSYGRNPFPVPATETIVLESSTLPFFRTDEIKLALWPDVEPESRAHCAIFLVAEDAPIVESTKSYQISYDTPVCNDDDSDSASEDGEEYCYRFHHKAIRPEEFNNTIPECEPIIMRAPKMKLKYPSSERGIVGTFARTSPFCYNVRVPRENPHLEPKLSQEQLDAQRIRGNRDERDSSDSGESSSESEEEDTRRQGRVVGPESTIPLLTPHAVVELDGIVTTVKFPYPVLTKSIILKFWLPTRRFDDVVLRKLEVHGSGEKRMFKTATRFS